MGPLHALIQSLAPTLQSLVDAFEKSDEMVHISAGQVEAGIVARWLIEGIAIMQLQ